MSRGIVDGCRGNLPSGPNVVNSQTLKVKKKTGLLDLRTHNMLDWAVEIRKGDRTTPWSNLSEGVPDPWASERPFV